MVASAHQILAWIVIIANGLVGAWALAAHSRDSLRGKALWSCVAVAQVLLFVQVALGVVRLSQLEADAPEFHTFYGFLTLIAVAILYGYRSQVEHIKHLVYGGGSLFIMGLAIRAMFLDATTLAA